MADAYFVKDSFYRPASTKQIYIQTQTKTFFVEYHRAEKALYPTITKIEIWPPAYRPWHWYADRHTKAFFSEIKPILSELQSMFKGIVLDTYDDHIKTA